MTKEIVDIQQKTQELFTKFPESDFHKLYVIPNGSMYRIYVSFEVPGKLLFGNLHSHGYYCLMTNTYVIDSFGFTTKNIDLFVKAIKELYNSAIRLQEIFDAN